jgi:hypothetical protein
MFQRVFFSCTFFSSNFLEDCDEVGITFCNLCTLPEKKKKMKNRFDEKYRSVHFYFQSRQMVDVI